MSQPINTIVGHIQNGFLSRMMNYSPPAIVFWLALANRADESGRCYPSINTLIQDTGLSKATIYRAMSELIRGGEITVTAGGGIGNLSNLYHLTGSSGNELVQEMNQSNSETKVVHSRDEGSLGNEHKPNNRTILRNQTQRRKRREPFIVPPLELVTAYCLERKNRIDPQYFLDYYETRGWKLKGGQPMKNWQAAIRTWERNNFSGSGKPAAESKPLAPLKILG